MVTTSSSKGSGVVLFCLRVDAKNSQQQVKFRIQYTQQPLAMGRLFILHLSYRTESTEVA